MKDILFQWLYLAAGESKRVAFTMKLSQLAFLDENMRWKVEKGDFDIRIGASSDDIRLHEKMYVARDHFVDGRTRGFWAESVIR